MGRKKSYDREVLIDKAMDMFRDHGFANTSTQMLTDGLGVNRFSLYAEFGSKQGIFDAALERYDEEVIGRRFRPLEAAGAGLDEIRDLLGFYGAATEGPASGRGCLLCNTAVELGPMDPSGAGFVERYFDRLASGFGNALSNAERDGALRTDVDVAAEASFFTAAVLGIFVMLRAKAPSSVIHDAVAVAQAHLASLRACA